MVIQLALAHEVERGVFLKGLEGWQKSEWQLRDVRADKDMVLLDENSQTMLMAEAGRIALALGKGEREIKLQASFQRNRFFSYPGEKNSSSSGGFLFLPSVGSQKEVYYAKNELNESDFRKANCSCLSFSTWENREYHRKWGYSLILLALCSPFEFSTAQKQGGDLGKFIADLKNICKGMIVVRTGILDKSQSPVGISRSDGILSNKLTKPYEKYSSQKHFGSKPRFLGMNLPIPKNIKFVKHGENIQKNIFPNHGTGKLPQKTKSEGGYKDKLDVIRYLYHKDFQTMADAYDAFKEQKEKTIETLRNFDSKFEKPAKILMDFNNAIPESYREDLNKKQNSWPK